MRIVMSWLREVVGAPLPPAKAVAEALIRAGFEVEGLETVGSDLAGVVVGEVVSIEVVPTKKKDVRWCQVRVAELGAADVSDAADAAGAAGAEVSEPGVRGVICGAFNFEVGDRVPVALPGSVLPGGFEISSRKTYGHVSDGMICSARELGLGDDHSGILVLPPDTPIGAHVAELLAVSDEVLDIAVTPDRGYGLSVRGIARETATAFGLPFGDPGQWGGLASDAGPLPGDTGDGGEAGAAGYPVRVEDTLACDRYVARVVSGVDPNARTPLGWARRLSLAGMRPISAPVDVTNIVMLGLGQPLHAFDRAKLSGPIVVRRARAGERLLTLDGVDRVLDPEDLVIADDSGPIALAGVMGGAATEISATTTDIVLESAHFDAIVVARTARRHRLGSEASRRFERGVDPALAPVAAQRAVDLLGELAGASAEPGGTDVDHRPAPVTIAFPLGEPERLAGRPYPVDVIRRRLADIGAVVSGPASDVASSDVAASGAAASGAAASGTVEVTVPSWRPDLARPADLVEEVVRLEGYDTIPVTLPLLPAGRGLTEAQRLRRAVGRALAADGFVEVLTLPFVGADAADVLSLPDGDPRRAAVRVTNPIAQDASYLRTTLLSGLIDAAGRNLGRGQTDLALFESGLVFREPAGGAVAVATPPVDRRPNEAEIRALDSALPDQPRHVAVILTGLREPAGWWGPGRAADWGDAVAGAHSVAAAVGVELKVSAGDVLPWHPGRCAELSVDGRVVGHAGELHPRVLGAAGLPARSCAMELDLDALIAVALERPAVAAPAISTFPPADRDVALVTGAEVPVAAVTEALRAGAGELLESLSLFDVYEGGQVGPGRRSLAFGLRLRAADRTLTAGEANDIRDAAVAEAASRTGAVLRG
ncbi:phenylalanyl-tRNA synthetase beta chain [Parafrankia irregularis]|uniref:Phenylalanine--tRNA ligase beta subunit n=1 Tax=Parafrankia irregularis TaxID=795642 RepID=A0A0S4QZG9_9ACTN|nr:MULTISPECIES: phenylalanine--tRNA ligase subunit beta [Parafrankia]CUU61024.1 phenylalanyl-tRNA synthetase beta chain [Parafrankia irregularis]